MKDTNLFCRRYGEHGESVVLIHGACADADFFHDTAVYLSKRYKVCTYDRRGYGRNENVREHSLETQADDVKKLIEKTGCPCHIIAHSAGTIIAMLLALKYPETIKSLLLYEPVASMLVKNDKAYLQALAETEKRIENGRYMSAAIRFFSLMGEKDKRAREASEEEMEHAVQNYRCFIQYEFHEISHTLPDIEKIKVPAVIGLGDQSLGAVREEMARELAKKMNCEVLAFPGGHNCPYDLPKEFACMAGSILEENSLL